jgi:cell division protease FtsH
MDGNATSPATRELVEADARRILDECARQALDVLTRERSRLERLVAALLEVETLDADEIYRASGLPAPGTQDSEGRVLDTRR